MSERRGTKGLELWCRRMTEGYPGVQVNNMTTSWRDGLAFCAIIHHFRPDLIDFSKLNKDDIYYNNDLAFQTAERHLGIPALLEPEDMVEFPVPDRLSILTYLSQFYQTFVVGQGSPSRVVPKRPINASDRGATVSPTSTSPSSKMPRPSGGVGRREPCAKCGLPVFLAERLNVGKQLYHRTCFRCARCNSQLTLANYYETETENQYCCETCPDEEQSKKDQSELGDKLTLNRSLSDEEKSAGLQKYDDRDDYSSMFESALENPQDKNLSTHYTLSNEQSTEFIQARSRFMTTQLLGSSEDDTSDAENEIAPDLPKSDPPSESKGDSSDLTKPDEPPDLPKTKPPDLSLDFPRDSENKPKDLSDNNVIAQCESYDSGYPSNTYSLDSVVNSISSAKTSDVSDRNQPETANKLLGANQIVTKEEIKFPKSNNSGVDNAESVPSLVKARMRLFEHKSATDRTKEEQKDVVSVIAVSPSKVPSEKEHFSPSELRIEKFNIEEVESDSINSSSVVDETDKNNKNHTKDLTDRDSVIVISDASNDYYVIDTSDSTKKTDSNEDISVNETHAISDTPSIIEISDSSDSKAVSKDEEYPDDLNPFGDDGDAEETDQKCNQDGKEKVSASLNPFDEDDDNDDNVHKLEENKNLAPSPKPAVRKKVKLRQSEHKITGTNDFTPEKLNQATLPRISYNPFEDDEDDNKKVIKNIKSHTMKVMPAPRISLNPFWSDGEEPSDEGENEKSRPIPLPRNSRSSIGTPEPKPRKSGLSINSGLSNTMFGSNTSLSSAHSSIGPSGRRKKQAPKPPASIVDKQQSSAQSSTTSSPNASVQHSPKLTPKVRKSKKAPLPPSSVTSTPIAQAQEIGSIISDVSPIANNEELKDPPKLDSGEWETEKIIKDELNRNRQSQTITNPVSLSETSALLHVPDKSTYGKWKRRKGPAPSRPIPQRRHIKPLPMAEIRRELEFIEIQQQGLEKQGVRLEQIIREKCEGPNADPDASLTPDVEDLMLQLFELVNERNELFRKQVELMYLRRYQRLEEEQADLEYQIRCLMLQPEANKTDSDKSREEELINRLVEVVERRNEIVECLEMDRIREAQEDDSINNQMMLYASKRKDESDTQSKVSVTKQKKKNKKEKKFKLKSKKVDVDKDIDESETSSLSSTTKDKKKKKFNIF